MNLTYLLLNLGFTALILLGLWRTISTLKPGAVAFTLLVTGLLTLVFDNLIVAARIVGYTHANTLGLGVPLAPVEDLGYTITGAFVVPALWNLFAPLTKGGK